MNTQDTTETGERAQSHRNPALSLVPAPPSTWWQGRTVLVTGCSGFLGSWLARTLVDLKANVVGLIRDVVPQSELQRSGTAQKIVTVYGDVCDQAFVERVLSEYRIETIFHLAAQSLVGVANLNPIGTLQTNIAGTWAVLEAARHVGRSSGGIEQILIASSDKAYGENETLPYTEETPLRGRHPYDVSKSCADLISQCYAATYGLPVCITRCGNLYGGGDLNWNRIVPGTMRAAIEGTPPVIRSDGSLTRDYLYVEDGVSAYLTLAEAMSKDASLAGRAFNFGNKTPISVLDLVQKMLQVADREDLQPQILGQADNEIPQQYLDSSQARQMLGWKPEYSLESGLRRTLEWYRGYLQPRERRGSPTTRSPKAP